MSSLPEEAPDFNFSLVPEIQFDSERIAEEVLWPMVDLFSRDRSWRDVSWPGRETLDTRRGRVDGELLEVFLDAGTELAAEASDQSTTEPYLHTVTIGIESIVTDQRREQIFTRANSHPQLKLHEKYIDNYAFKIANQYYFDTSGNMAGTSRQLIEDADGGLYWDSIIGFAPDVIARMDKDEEYDDEDESTTSPKNLEDCFAEGSDDMPDNERILEHDLERLESGIYILKPTKAIRKALTSIRHNPIETPYH